MRFFCSTLSAHADGLASERVPAAACSPLQVAEETLENVQCLNLY